MKSTSLRQGGGRYSLSLAQDIQTTLEEGYDAFTKPDLLSDWFSTAAIAELRVAGRYRNLDNDEGEFLVLERPNRLQFTWENPDHCPGTIIEVDFESIGKGQVRLSLEHSGIRDEDGDRDMTNGWSWALDSLKSFLETGSPIPHEVWEKTRESAVRDKGS